MEDLIKATNEMYLAGKKVLEDPGIPERMKELIRIEIENHKRCMELLTIREG